MTEEKRLELDKLEEFSKHLDECEQCFNNPHGLCPVGHQLAHAFMAGGLELKTEGFLQDIYISLLS